MDRREQITAFCENYTGCPFNAVSSCRTTDQDSSWWQLVWFRRSADLEQVASFICFQHTSAISTIDDDALYKFTFYLLTYLSTSGRLTEDFGCFKRLLKTHNTLGIDIINRRCKSRLSNINGRVDPKKMWAEVRKLTCHKQEASVADGLTANSFNQHYTRISTDSDYIEPRYKQTASQLHVDCQYITEWHMFRILDGLHHTATGLDNLPAWFLRFGAPVFSEPNY